MKILHVLDHSLPLHSGYTFRSRNIFRCQQEQGLELAVVTSPKHEESWKGQGGRREEIDGVRYYRSGPLGGRQLPVFGERKLMAVLERRILQVAREERPQVLHAHSPVLNALPALRAGRRLAIPVVYEIRAFWEDAAVDHGSYRENGIKYRLVRSLETRACRRVHRVITICQGLRKDLESRGISGETLSVVPNAVNADEFTPIERDRELGDRWGLDGCRVVGFLGSFYHYEGLDLLLEAFARLHASRGAAGAGPGGVKLLLVGGGRMDPVLRERAAALGIGDRVIFTGRLPHDQMPAVYSLVDVLCFPRKPMRLTELVTPLKPLETMAMGKAMVASDVGGHRELIRDGETGLLFRPDDAPSLAGCLEKVLGDDGLRRALEEQGRAWVSRHRTWKANGERYRSLYEGLMNR